MKYVLGFDLEATSLDVTQARIVEVGACIWDVEKKVPVEVFSSFVRPDEEGRIQPQEAYLVNKIEQEWIDGGMPLSAALGVIHTYVKLYSPEFLVAHNGINYDIPLLGNECQRNGIISPILQLPFLDTRQDLPIPDDKPARKLVHMAAEHGFVNPFPHRALFDVLTMMKVFSMYDYAEIAAQSKVPFVVLRCMVDYDNRQKAKDLRFSWEEVDGKKYPKCWVKKVRQNKVDQEMAAAEKLGVKLGRIE